jgi:hypothetical protein
MVSYDWPARNTRGLGLKKWPSHQGAALALIALLRNMLTSVQPNERQA